MLKRIRKFLESGDTTAESSDKTFHDKQLAAAALLVEAATLDGSFDEEEHLAILDLLKRSFGLSADDAEELIKEGTRHQGESTHLIRFTRTIKDHYSEEERIELIEALWEVAYADGVLHDYEANLLRRIGGLIYVSERERGDAKKRVMARLGING